MRGFGQGLLGVGRWLVFGMVFCVGTAAWGDDWPMWRYDGGRTASSPGGLAGTLHLQWQWQLPAVRSAFSGQPRLRFDGSYEPVVMGKRLFLPSMHHDSVTAIDTETGAVVWRFFAEGPVRLAPVAWAGKVYFVADDGYLYCVDTQAGELLWKFRGQSDGHAERKLLGNERLISRWAARGGPVLADGVIYFAAGVFPFEGAYVHALEAATGKVLWTNDKSGWLEDGLIDHITREAWRDKVYAREDLLGNVREGGLSPQGYLAVLGDQLAVPSGRAFPGFFDRGSGTMSPYVAAWGGRANMSKGCWYVSGIGDRFFVGGDLYDLASRARVQFDPSQTFKEQGEFREPVLSAEAVYYSAPINEQATGTFRPVGIGYAGIGAYDLAGGENEVAGHKQPAGLWELASDLKVHIRAGGRLYAGGAGQVAALDLPVAGKVAQVSWRGKIEGTPSRMLAADDRLFVVTQEGGLYCFGDRKVASKSYAEPTPQVREVDDAWVGRAARLLRQTGAPEGYCVALGLGTGRLVEELLRQSDLHVIAVDADGGRVERFRQAWAKIGLYGRRVHILHDDLASAGLPSYMAGLAVSEDLEGCGFEKGAAFVAALFETLRPYGGVAYLPMDAAQDARFTGWVASAGSAGAALKRVGETTLLVRQGAPAGAADWTHESADAGNTFASKDRLVKDGFGVLWFGGSVDQIFPEWDYNHFRGPAPLVAGGRMFIQVGTELHATDIYTGRHLWEAALPGPAEKGSGFGYGNYVALADAVYVLEGKRCVIYDPRTGGRTGEMEIPVELAPEEGAEWEELRVVEDRVMGASGKHLFCLDRRSGKTLWTYRGQGDRFSFAVGNDKVFAVNYVAPAEGAVAATDDRIAALRAVDGEVVWEKRMKISGEKPFGPMLPQLGYNDENDVLILSVNDETVGAFGGATGDVLWQHAIISNDPPSPWSAPVPPILHHGALVTHGGEVFDPLTGQRREMRFWVGMNEPSGKVLGARGCARAVACEHLVFVRDAYASYYDFSTGKQTFLRGIRTGCTMNLIPAGGLLNSPNFARGCSCNYALFTSLALMHMPESAGWRPESKLAE